MTSTVIKCFGVISKVHRFDKSIDQGLKFPELLKNDNIENNISKAKNNNNIKKKPPYTCLCCEYTTLFKNDMRKHLYKKEPCPKIKNLIDLTDEIKIHILKNRIYLI
jgi:hypothetical protein